jgi:hypothetical protein
VIDRFGLPANTFDGLRLVRHGAKTLALVADDLAPPVHPAPGSYGLAVLHAGMRDPKLTTAAAMAFGGRARRNVLDLGPCPADPEGGAVGVPDGESEGRIRAEAYVAREDLELSAQEAGRMTGPGYAIVRWAGAALGVGWFRPHVGRTEGDRPGGSIRSLFPKRWG